MEFNVFHIWRSACRFSNKKCGIFWSSYMNIQVIIFHMKYRFLNITHLETWDSEILCISYLKRCMQIFLEKRDSLYITEGCMGTHIPTYNMDFRWSYMWESVTTLPRFNMKFSICLTEDLCAVLNKLNIDIFILYIEIRLDIFIYNICNFLKFIWKSTDSFSYVKYVIIFWISKHEILNCSYNVFENLHNVISMWSTWKPLYVVFGKWHEGVTTWS